MGCRGGAIDFLPSTSCISGICYLGHFCIKKEPEKDLKDNDDKGEDDEDEDKQDNNDDEEEDIEKEDHEKK